MGSQADPAVDELPLSVNQLSALALVSSSPRSVETVAERLSMTRQGAYKLLQKLRTWGYVSRRRLDGRDLYGLCQSPILHEAEVITSPGRAKVFVCIRFDP